MSLEGASTAKEGSYAPIGLYTQLTRPEDLKIDRGPIIDSNPVFDSVFITAKPLNFKLTAEKTKPD